MAKTNDSDAPAADTTQPQAAPAAASTPVAARSPRTGLRIAGVAAGSVLAAALLFGGGVAVGLALPSGHASLDFASGQSGALPGDRDGARPGGRDGERPNSRDGARPGGHDHQRPPIGGDRPPHGHHNTDGPGNTDGPDGTDQPDNTDITEN